MAGATGKVGGVVLVAVLLTLLGGTDVDLVTLKVDGLLHDPGKDPGALADTGGLEGKADDKEDVGEGVGKEGDGEGRSNKLPRDGSHDGGDDGTEEASVEEVLEGVADAPKVLLTLGDGKSGHTSDNEEAGNDGKLTANHEAGKVAALALEEEVAGLESELGLATVLLLDLGDGEEGNLHTLEHTDDGHEDEEKDDGDASGNTLPHGGLALEESGESDGESESENGNGEEDTAPEEESLEAGAGTLLGLDGLAGELGNDDGNEVRGVHDTGDLDGHGNVQSEEGEVVVDVVKHAVRGVDLGGELTDHASQKNHGETSDEEDLGDPGGKAPKLGTGDGSTGKVDKENNEDNHELTAHEVTVKVVALVGDAGALVRELVGLGVNVVLDGGKTDEGGLSTLNHREPDEERPQHNEGGGRVGLLGQTGLVGELEASHQNDRKDQKSGRVDALERIAVRCDCTDDNIMM